VGLRVVRAVDAHEDRAVRLKKIQSDSGLHYVGDRRLAPKDYSSDFSVTPVGGALPSDIPTLSFPMLVCSGFSWGRARFRRFGGCAA
jgi:hypothetical protein